MESIPQFLRLSVFGNVTIKDPLVVKEDFAVHLPEKCQPGVQWCESVIRGLGYSSVLN